MHVFPSDSIESLHAASIEGILVGIGSASHRPISAGLAHIHAPYFLLHADFVWFQGSQFAVANDKRVRINGFDNLIHPSNRGLLEEVDASAESLLRDEKIELLPSSHEKTAQVLVDCVWASNYYHFNVDVIGKIMIASKFLDIYSCEFLLNAWKPYQREALDLLNLSYRWIGYDSIFKGKVYIPSLPGASGAAPRETLLFIKNLFLNAVSVDASPVEFIYISRRKARRSILNEDQLLEALCQLAPFVRVDLEDMRLNDQIAIIKNAGYVVSSHGAGLINCLHMANPKGIFEIFGDKYQAKMFRYMAYQLNIKYAAYGEDCDIMESGQGAGWDKDYTVSVRRICLEFKDFMSHGDSS